MNKPFIDLEPRIAKHPTKENWWCLSFICPGCGPPYRIVVNALEGGPSDQSQALWSVIFGGTKDIREALTITPSISNVSPTGHGRKKSCGWHGNIVAGFVISA